MAAFPLESSSRCCAQVAARWAALAAVHTPVTAAAHPFNTDLNHAGFEDGLNSVALDLQRKGLPALGKQIALTPEVQKAINTKLPLQSSQPHPSKQPNPCEAGSRELLHTGLVNIAKACQTVASWAETVTAVHRQQERTASTLSKIRRRVAPRRKPTSTSTTWIPSWLSQVEALRSQNELKAAKHQHRN